MHKPDAKVRAVLTDHNLSGNAPLAHRPIAVLVLGMHRSGTSALTRVVSLLGADLPRNLIPGVEGDNAMGFWESADVNRLNTEILASAGSTWDDWRCFNPEWIRSPAKQAFKIRAVELLNVDFSASSLFVLKDPRICRLLPFWLEVLRDLDAEPRCLLPIRNPLEVAASLRRRDGFSTSKSQMLWLRHVVDAEHETRGSKRAILFYDDLLDDWRDTVGEFSRELNVAWPGRSATAEVAIDRFLNHRNRHHALSSENVAHHSDLTQWVKDAYSALKSLRVEAERADAQRHLDEIRSELNRASHALGSVLRSEELAREESKVESAARIRELESNIEELESRLETVFKTVSEKNANAASLEQALSDRVVSIHALEQDLSGSPGIQGKR